ncbi:MAG TPA: S8 family serine peptidase [Thermoanaerobaculia bacterium]
MKSFLSILVLLSGLQVLADTPRRYIVEYTPGVRAQLRGERRFQVRREFSRVLNGAAIELADGVSIDQITRLPYVARVTPDAIVTAYGREDAGGTAAWKPALRAADGGQGIVVAVIDTGVDHQHPALAGKVIGGYDFVNDDDDPMDDHRHGTHVAGIIAASSSTMNGVAPGVSLLAYKVLDQIGNGEMSAIVAGIDRAVADGADVINLSLGMGGHPGDPMARAVDAATAAGVVVVVAAGNAGEFHSIGSPGVAATAITVGAAETATTLAEFSSRGPTNRSGAIKPEVLAPGVAILSTVPDGQFGHSSGTSMAAPYVAGVAALLRAAHPEWTPARVKAALVSTALPLAGEEVMAQGAGRVDLARASASDLVVAPVQINFGLDGGIAPLWSSTRTLTLRNDSGMARTVRVRNESALTIRMTPEEVTLGPGSSRDVELAIEVDHRILGKPPTRSFSFGGWVVLEWDGGDARVPWAFVRAGRAVVTYPGARPQVVWNTGERYGSIAVEAGGVEALLEPGVYDLVAMTEREGDVRVFVAEERAVTGDVLFALTETDAPHAVTLDGVDARGLPLESPAVRARFVLPETSLVLPPFGRTVHTSAFSPKYALLAIEASFDGGTMHVVQHPPVRGLSGDVTLRNQPADFAEEDVRLRFPDARERSIVLLPRDWPRRQNDFGPAPQPFSTAATGSAWTLRLRMTAEHEGDHAGGVQMAAFPGEAAVPELITPMIRRDAGGFFGSWSFVRGPVADSSLDYGAGAIHAVAQLTVTESALVGTYEIRGEGGELYRSKPTTYRVLDASGAEVAKGEVLFQSLFVPLPGAGPYRAELKTGQSVMTLRFMAGGAVPSLKSFAVDGASLVFSADGAPAVFFRRRGAMSWVQLSPVGENGVYRVDLEDVVRVSRDVEVAIELTGQNGNSASWVTPVMIPAAKRQAVRR